MSKKWTVISIGSRFLAVTIGIIQSVIIAKLLTVENYGLLNIVMGIGASLGVYQNLGISSGSTREIASSESKAEAYKVFITSLAIRYMISIPMAVGLFIFAAKIAEQTSNRSEIILPLQLFAVTMVIQSLQSVLNSVIQGFRKFQFLFGFQIIIAFVSLSVYIPLIFKFEFLGYFYSLILFNLISTIALLIYAYKLFDGQTKMPTRNEFITIFKSIFKVGVFIYLMKIIDTQWQRLQPFLLGFVTTDYKIGVFSFALLIASKVATVSDAITDVTLPSMTNIYERSREEFRAAFLKGSSFANLLLVLCVVVLILFKAEIFYLIDVLFSFMGKEHLSIKYGESFKYIDWLAIAFWGYSQLNLIRSGYSVPAKKLMGSFLSYVVLFVFTYVFYTTFNQLIDPIWKLSVAMGAAALISYLFAIIYTKYESDFWIISFSDIVYLLISIVVIFAFYIGISNWFLIMVYGFFTFWIYKTNE
jgi:hypothetical protein